MEPVERTSRSSATCWQELAWDARVQPNEIGVAVKDGIVSLTGWVDSYLKKWRLAPPG